VTVKDWQEIAQARGLEIPAGEWDRIGPALDALEAAFRPLAAAIPPELDPAPVFAAGEDGP